MVVIVAARLIVIRIAGPSPRAQLAKRVLMQGVEIQGR